MERLSDTHKGMGFIAIPERASSRAEGITKGREEEMAGSFMTMISLDISPEKIAEKYQISPEEALRIANLK